MKKSRHVMIDLETMGRVPEMAIVSIGAVVFDPRYGDPCSETFYEELDWQAQNRFCDPETRSWWMGKAPHRTSLSKRARGSSRGIGTAGCVVTAGLQGVGKRPYVRYFVFRARIPST